MQREMQHLSQYMMSITIQDTSFFAIKSVYKVFNFTTSAIPVPSQYGPPQIPLPAPMAASTPIAGGVGDVEQQRVIAPNNVDTLVNFLSSVHDNIY